MATSLGTLTLDLVARISEFTEPLDKAERRAKSANDSIVRSFNASELSMKAFSAAAAGVSVAAITQFTSKVIEQGNEIQKLAKLSNASVQQFQYYATGAKAAGMSMEQFADKMKDMQDRIGDFQQTGGGPMADFFRNIGPLIGVTVDQFQKLSGPQALQLFYDSLEKAGASTNDIKFYMEQIISDSSELIPLLENGGKGFKEWGDAAANAGAVMSDSTIKSLAEAKKNLAILDMQFEGLKATMVNGIVPAFEVVSQHMDDIKAVAAAAGAVLVTRLAVGAGLAAFQMTQVAIASARAAAGVIGFAGAAGAARLGALSLMGALAAVGGPAGLAMLAVQAIAAGAAFLYVKRTSNETTPALDGKTQSIREMTDAYNQMSAAQRKAALFDETKRLSDLQQQYSAAQVQVRTYAAGLGNLSTVSDQSKSAIAGWVSQFDHGKLSAQQLADKVAGLSDVSGEYVSYLVQYTKASDNAKAALDNQKNVLISLNAATGDAKTADEQHTVAINAKAQAMMKLTEAQRSYYNSLNAEASKREYFNQLVTVQGVPVDRANALVTAHEQSQTPFNQPLPSPVLQQAMKQLANTTYQFDAAQKKAIARVQVLANQYDFATIEKANRLPAGTLSGIALQETRGRNDLVSPVGAKGVFQFMPATAQRFNIAGRETDIAASAAAAGKYLGWLMQRYNGDMVKAITAYHSGEGNVDKGRIGPVGRAYAPGVMRWMAGANGSNKIDMALGYQTTEQELKAITDQVQTQVQLQDQQRAILAAQGTELDQLAAKHQQTLQDFQKTFAGNPEGLKKAIAAENQQYEAQRTKLIADQKAEYQQRFAFETYRITQIQQNAEHEKSLIDANTEYTDNQRKAAKAAVDRQAAAEVAAFRLSVDEKMAASRDFYSNEVQIAIAAAIRKKRAVELDTDLTKAEKQEQTQFIEDQLKQQLDAITLNNDKMLLDSQQYFMTEADYMQQRYEQERREIEQTARAKNQSPELTAAQLAASRERQKREESQRRDAAYQAMRGAVIAEDPVAQMQDQYSTELAQQGDLLNKKLISYEQYQQAYAAITDRYAKQEYMTRMDLYGSMLSQAGTVWDSMTEMVRKSAGEQSAAYKVMFAVQKAVAVAQAIINTEEAATKALTLGPIFGIPASTAVRAMGYMSAGIIAGQAIAGLAGFSDGGYTGPGGKYQPAGLVHAGEIVWSQDDIKRWGGIGVVEGLRTGKGYADGGVVGNSPALKMLEKANNRPVININHDPSLAVTTREDSNGNVQISIARREARLEAERNWRNLNNPNSMESRQVQRNFDARVKR